MRLSRIIENATNRRDLTSSAFGSPSFSEPGTKRAGVKVTKTTVTQLSAVYGSWRIISEAVATLPKSCVLADNPAFPTLLDDPMWFDFPNLSCTWVEFLGQTMVSLLQDGNAYILVQWGKDGEILMMTVLDPSLCEQKPDGLVEVTNRDNGQKEILPEAGTMLGKRSNTEVLHIRGMTKPGELDGMSPIKACAEVFGVSLAAQKYGASFFENDATPGGLIEVPKETRLSEIGQEALRKSWKDLYGGPNRAKNVAVLVEGAQFKSLQVNPNEAQFLETRKFGVQEVARIYGVPPHLLSDTTNTTGWGTGMSEQNTAFVIHTLRPWLERVEARFSALLTIAYYGDIPLEGQPRVYLKINEEALLRGATKERWEVLRKNVAGGLMTADEAREQEGLPPLPEELGAVPWIPLSQAPESEDPDDESSQSTNKKEDDEKRD